MPDLTQSVQAALSERFGERIAVDPALPGLDELRRIAGPSRAPALSGP